MTPKQKAKYLLEDFINADSLDAESYISKDVGKQCALICVEEILTSVPLEPSNVNWDDCGAEYRYWYIAQREEANLFWNKVKAEIEKL